MPTCRDRSGRLNDPGSREYSCPQGIALPRRNDHSCTAGAQRTIIVALEGGAAIIFIVVALRAMLLGAEQLAQLFIGGQWGLEPLGPRCSQKLAGK